MTTFLFGRMFFWDLLLCGLVLTASLPKRNRPALRVAGAFIVCTLIGVGWSWLFERLPDILPTMILNYFCAYLIVLRALLFVVQLDGWAFVYTGTFIWFTQQIANAFDFALLPSRGMSILAFLSHVAVVLAASLLVYRFCTRKFQAPVLQRLKLDRVAPVWLMMCLMCCGLNSYASMAGQTTQSFYLAELCFNLFGILYLNSLYQLSGVEREEESVRFLMDQSRKQYVASRENIEQLNIKSHDLKHQIRAFRKQGQIDDRVLNDIETTISQYDAVVHTGNEALDTILTEKSLACQAKGIGFTCMAEGSGLEKIEAADLYALFGNALDNAIEATLQLEDAEKKQISFTMHRVGGFYLAQLQNYSKDRLDLSEGLPKTTKQDKLNHGFGVKSMQLLADKYGGQLSFTQDEDVVELDLLLPAEEKKQA